MRIAFLITILNSFFLFFNAQAESIHCESFTNGILTETIDFNSGEQASQRLYDKEGNIVVNWGIGPFVRIKKSDSILYLESAMNLLSHPDSVLEIKSTSLLGNSLPSIFTSYPRPFDMTCTIAGVALPTIEPCHSPAQVTQELVQTLKSSMPNAVKVAERLECGANANFKDQRLLTPLHNVVNRAPEDLLIQEFYKDSIAFLLEHKAELNSKDIAGNTPLMIAAKSGQDFLVESLLDYNADIKIKNNKGQTAYDISKTSGISEFNQDNLNPANLRVVVVPPAGS